MTHEVKSGRRTVVPVEALYPMKAPGKSGARGEARQRADLRRGEAGVATVPRKNP